MTGLKIFEEAMLTANRFKYTSVLGLLLFGYVAGAQSPALTDLRRHSYGHGSGYTPDSTSLPVGMIVSANSSDLIQGGHTLEITQDALVYTNSCNQQTVFKKACVENVFPGKSDALQILKDRIESKSATSFLLAELKDFYVNGALLGHCVQRSMTVCLRWIGQVNRWQAEVISDQDSITSNSRMN